MGDSSIAVAGGATGPLVDVFDLTNGLSQTVKRQAIVVASPTDIGAVQDVLNEGDQPTADKGAAVVALRKDTTGSAGLDFSANAPTWPDIGDTSFDSGNALYPSWILIATVPADPSRLRITVDNMDAQVILCLRDDGTAGNGSAPVNPTAFQLNPKVDAGPEGGHFESETWRGRLRCFALSSAFVSISTD